MLGCLVVGLAEVEGLVVNQVRWKMMRKQHTVEALMGTQQIGYVAPTK
jgi:hypothetical protein